MKNRHVSVSEFKAKCLALIDEVAKTGLPVIVTKYGKPVAKLTPWGDIEPPDLLGSVRYESEEDLLAPVEADWEAAR